uniref:(northern house mosquito) hypothetical protein n=1 Tax=Culex pipiens TaxID=7175 RepID=A0A8D8B6F2_CULPI
MSMRISSLIVVSLTTVNVVCAGTCCGGSSMTFANSSSGSGSLAASSSSESSSCFNFMERLLMCLTSIRLRRVFRLTPVDPAGPLVTCRRALASFMLFSSSSW